MNARAGRALLTAANRFISAEKADLDSLESRAAKSVATHEALANEIIVTGNRLYELLVVASWLEESFGRRVNEALMESVDEAFGDWPVDWPVELAAAVLRVRALQRLADIERRRLAFALSPEVRDAQGEAVVTALSEVVSEVVVGAPRPARSVARRRLAGLPTPRLVPPRADSQKPKS